MKTSFLSFSRFLGETLRANGIWRRAGGTKGFTLVELLVVIAVIGVMAALSIPMFRGWGLAINATRAADDLSTNLLYARAKGIALNTCYKVTFDTVGNTYSLFSYSNQDCSGSGTLEKTISMADLNVRYGCNAGQAGYPSGGNSCPATGTGITYSTNYVTFNSQGRASSDGYIYLIPTADMGKFNGNMKAIEVNALTGRIRRYSCCPAKGTTWD